MRRLNDSSLFYHAHICHDEFIFFGGGGETGAVTTPEGTIARHTAVMILGSGLDCSQDGFHGEMSLLVWVDPADAPRALAVR